MIRHTFSKRSALATLLTLGTLAISPAGHAQSLDGQGLLGLDTSVFANDVEVRAALANQQTFDILDAQCNPGGVLDRVVNPDASPNQACAGDVFSVYLTIRELVHTANDLLGVGPTVASLGLDQEGLGAALRWTAAEELAAQGSAATEFSNSQLSNLASRINALRFGARGFSIAGAYIPTQRDDVRVAQAGSGRRGGGASADGNTFSSWGGFINGSFGYGSKDDTDLENAFDFDGSELTIGVDYRFANNIVLGGMLGWTRQTIDFDEAASDIRVVDGGLESDGMSAIAFGLYQGEKAFMSASLGLGSLDYDVERQIKYGSNNPDIGAANSVALSTPSADTVTATFNAGYAFNYGRLIIEPQFNLQYLDVTIDAFSEQRSITQLGNVDDDAFNL
ncbi:MAG: autotransporter outer membrane beta-barrel domain-containing protein, partial [Gammaproteobacteria bacterium]